MKRQTWISMHGKKRINPKTGKLFTTGDVRDDGYVFVRYNKKLKLNGFFAEQWRPQVLDGKKRINPNTGQPFKYGDYDPENATRRFIGYLKKYVSKEGLFKEAWSSASDKRWVVTGKKRNNPNTNTPFKRGDWHPDNPELRFVSYQSIVDEHGLFRERWLAADDNFWENAGNGSKFSLAELRIFSELNALFPSVKFRHQYEKREIDVYISELRVGIEFDGWYWHKDKEILDRTKTSFLTKNGIKIIRVRQAPLEKLNDLDLIVEQGPLQKSDIDQIIELIAVKNSKTLSYLAQDEFLNKNFYIELVKNLPSPPFKSSFAYLYPEAANDWDKEKNAPFLPSDFLPGSNWDAHWKCATCEYSWSTTLNSRGPQKRGCRDCAMLAIKTSADESNSLFARRPDLAAWFADDLNAPVYSINNVPSWSNNEEIWWRCIINHLHTFQNSPSAMQQKSSNSWCPFCYQSQKNSVDARNEEMKQKSLSGMSNKDIAKKFSLSPQTVGKILSSFDEIRARDEKMKRKAAEIEENIINLRSEGLSHPAIGRRVSKDRKFVEKVLRERGITAIEQQKVNERNKLIITLRSKGYLLQDIATKVGLSRERVGEICKENML